MYIIFKFGNKQYKAQQGELIDVDFIKSKISLKISILNTLLILEKDKIILNHIKLKTYEIIAFVRFQIKSKKITLLKFKRRKHSMKKKRT